MVFSMLTNMIKKLAHLLLGHYSIYYVYASPEQSELTLVSDFEVRPTNETEIKQSTDSLMREQAGYSGAESYAYACFDKERMVGVCFYWFGDRYRTRNFWPLADREAKLVQIATVPDMRGRGIATQLIEASYSDLINKGFSHVYARIWHSNTPSIRAFERNGWSRIALIIEINPLRQSKAWRLRFNKHHFISYICS
jgi:ribosomal protein S18 acetylase RimI-like enzyme